MKLYAYVKFRNGKVIQKRVPDNFVWNTSWFAFGLSFVLMILFWMMYFVLIG